MGEAWIDTQPLNEKSAGSVALKASQSLRTENGAAEVILASEVFMRMGKDSFVKMISLSLTNLALIEGHLQVATKPDESCSPSLFTFRSYFAAIHHH
jgi:hypothetical protein